MREQFDALLGMVSHPKTTILSLPSYRFFFMSFIISAYFGIAKSLNKGHFGRLSLSFDSKVVASLLILIFMVVGFVLGSLLVKGIVGLFGKRLTMIKIMNLAGYSQTPRLLISVPFSLIFAFLPPDIRAGIVTGESKVLIVIFAVFAALGFALLIYSTYLLIWGLVKCPDVRNET